MSGILYTLGFVRQSLATNKVLRSRRAGYELSFSSGQSSLDTQHAPGAVGGRTRSFVSRRRGKVNPQVETHVFECCNCGCVRLLP